MYVIQYSCFFFFWLLIWTTAGNAWDLILESGMTTEKILGFIWDSSDGTQVGGKQRQRF